MTRQTDENESFYLNEKNDDGYDSAEEEHISDLAW